MKKFEIINNKWIRVPSEKLEEYVACKFATISRISYVSLSEEGHSGNKYAIGLCPSGGDPTFIWYKTSEFELLKHDLAFLENLLFREP